MILYPPLPEPHTIEVEATNYCSAKCVFCPHSKMQRPKGYLDLVRFKNFLSIARAKAKSTWLYEVSNGQILPKVVFAGLGEPTLHPDIAELIGICTEFGFESQLVTNGAHLNEKLILELESSGLNNLAISLHSLNPLIYKSVMSLNLETTLPRIEKALLLLANSDVNVEIWRVHPPVGMPRESIKDRENFREFIQKHPFVKVLGPSEPWERDGVVQNSIWPVINDDPNHEIWCHKLYFTLNLCWDGTVVMCCVDYHRTTVPLGNAFEDSYEKIQQRRNQVLKSQEKPHICVTCKRWKDDQYLKLFAEHIQPNV